MEWKCSYDRRHTRALIDFSGDRPEVVGCLECDWSWVAGDADEWRAGSMGQRCFAALTSRPGRCDGRAVYGGYCWRHQGEASSLHTDQALYSHFRAHPEDLPQLYRLLLDQAMKTVAVGVGDQALREQLIARAKEIRVRPERGASLVYFVQREGLTKIGVTTNLKRRLKALSKGSCNPPGMAIGPVELLATEPGDRSVEESLHWRFRKTRIPGTEWFRPSKALRNYIDDLKRYQQNEDHFMRRVGAA